MITLPENTPDYLKQFSSTIKETSTNNNGEVFIDSGIEVINFDEVKNNINKKLKSNDALFITQNNTWTFIEFKSGLIRNDVEQDCIVKIYDTILLTINIAFEKEIDYIANNPMQFFRNNCNYYLVYGNQNEPYNEKYMTDETKKYLNAVGYFQQNKSKNMIAKHIANKAKEHYILFGLHKFRGYLFKEVYTLSKDEFKKKFNIV